MENKYTEAYKKIRNDWGMVKPYTRVQKNKKKYSRKVKYKAGSAL